MARADIRLYIKGNYSRGLSIDLEKDHVHYLANVMRLNDGANVFLFNGTDGLWQASLNLLGRNKACLNLLKQVKPQYSEPDIWLYFAPVKNVPTNYIIQKAVELGVAGFQPIITQNTINHKFNHERLETIIIEAAEQCERLTIPQIIPAKKLTSVLDNWQDTRHIIVCNESGDGLPPFQALKNKPTGSYAIFIGPEGGFSKDEFANFSKMSNLTNITLGPRILRADTACLVALACCQSMVGDWNISPRFKPQELGT